MPDIGVYFFGKHKTKIFILLIIIFASISYSNTFSVPFHFDDQTIIVKNVLLRDLTNFFTYSEGYGLIKTILSRCENRYVGLLSFALNFHFHGLDVTGYHVVNLFIHIANALLVYFLVIITFQTERLQEKRDWDVHVAALFSSLLFVSHPVQTQAVTYIAQRFSSLMTFFYLLSLLLYILSRISVSRKAHLLSFSLSVLSAILAMKTKENAFTLPLVITLYEFLFIEATLKERALHLAPFLLTMLIIPINLLGIEKPVGEIIGAISDQTMIQTKTTRWEYLLTQFRVIVTYLRILVLPVNQNLDYDYPLSTSFFETSVLLSFLVLALLFSLAIYLLFRSRKDNPIFSFFSFGILWFFITLSVESSIIPIADVIFEHRLYLPSVGLFIAFPVILRNTIALNRKRWRSLPAFASILCVVAVLLLSFATYKRNRIWASSISLWSDVVKKSPHKARGHLSLAESYILGSKYEMALPHLKTALMINPNSALAYKDMAMYYYKKGQQDLAILYFREAVRLKPDLTEAHEDLGFCYLAKGDIDNAIRHLEKSAALDPTNPRLHLNLYIAYKSKGLTSKAMQHRKIAERLDPSLFNLGQ